MKVPKIKAVPPAATNADGDLMKNNADFMKLRTKDVINVRLTIVEFGSETEGHLCIARTATGDKCFIRPADIEEVAAYHVKPGDCVDYASVTGGKFWGVVGPKVGNYHSVFRYNEQDKTPDFIHRVDARKPLPDGYEWPRKVAT